MAASLWFIHMPGCHACHNTVGEVVHAVRRIQAERPHQLRAFPVDLQTTQWKAERWMPRVTPTLLILVDGRGFDPKHDVLEGQRSAAQIYQWTKARMR